MIKTLEDYLKENNWNFGKEWLLSGKKITSQNNAIIREVVKQNNIDFLKWIYEEKSELLNNSDYFYQLLTTAILHNKHELISFITNNYLNYCKGNQGILKETDITTVLITYINKGYLHNIDILLEAYFTQPYSNKNSFGYEFLKTTIFSTECNKLNESLQLELLKKIIKHDDMNNSMLSYKNDLLNLACIKGKISIIEFLLTKNLNFKLNDYEAVKSVIKYDNIKVFEYLMTTYEELQKNSYLFLNEASSTNALQCFKYLEKKVPIDIEILKIIVKNKKNKSILDYIVSNISLIDLKEIIPICCKNFKPLLQAYMLEKELLKSSLQFKKIKI